MDNDTSPSNPFANQLLPPFGGREQVFAHIYNHLNDPPNTGAVAFLGRRHIGKTALLRQVEAMVETNHLGVYIHVNDVSLDGESSLLQTLIPATIDAIILRGYSLRDTQIPEEDDAETLQSWFAEVCLPEIFHVIRSHNRLILLLDDVHYLVQDAVLGRIYCTQLHSLLHPQLGIAVTLDLEHENYLHLLQPLVITDQCSSTH